RGAFEDGAVTQTGFHVPLLLYSYIYIRDVRMSTYTYVFMQFLEDNGKDRTFGPTWLNSFSTALGHSIRGFLFTAQLLNHRRESSFLLLTDSAAALADIRAIPLSEALWINQVVVPCHQY